MSTYGCFVQNRTELLLVTTMASYSPLNTARDLSHFNLGPFLMRSYLIAKVMTDER